jgi:hypothetical protein
MSHFLTGVVVRKALVDEADAEVNRLLDPYDENFEVEPYNTKCGCVGFKAQVECWKLVDKRFGKMDDVRKTYWSRMKVETEDMDKATAKEHQDTEWAKLIEPRKLHEAELLEKRFDTDKPDIECEDCGGTGVRKTTYNPDSKWDWWSYGGRWNGEIKGEYRGDNDGGFNFGDEYRQLEENIIRVGDFLDMAEKDSDMYPFAVVMPDGTWHERGRMGWWMVVTDEKPKNTHHEELKLLLAAYSDDYIVGIDCHI